MDSSDVISWKVLLHRAWVAKMEEYTAMNTWVSHKQKARADISAHHPLVRCFSKSPSVRPFRHFNVYPGID